MPIYAYKCSACGFAKDVLQKMSDPLLTDCPSCLQATFSKQVTAAGFQLKGSGWYVTDFRDGGSATAATAATATTAASPAATPVSTGDAPAAAPATATPAPAASSASPE
jgi:putative FmdB family regulatory protein